MKRVLIVDDEVDLAEVLAELLADLGHDVETARDGREALAKIAVRRPDVVITDMMMPVMNGPELIERLSQDPAMRDILVIAMSAAERPQHRPFLKKPLSLKALLELLK